jgi:hypothetical protein
MKRAPSPLRLASWWQWRCRFRHLSAQRLRIFRPSELAHQLDRTGFDRDAAEHLHDDTAQILVDKDDLALEPHPVAWLRPWIDDRVGIVGRKDVQGYAILVALAHRGEDCHPVTDVDFPRHEWDSGAAFEFVKG